ncbi:lipopolysaccharide biosynthesis protein [Bacteroides sp. ET336]|uniref:lipopolysaccharide biosynthesis protein n=1 Tax=Bacteroides sp. ET336 TaxID=2972459 RepID=UPI0021ABD4C0|nr:oligosaccharide flippase family protein [Bacteroides sp. ET336]MCR8894197.1 oligosaccharide flippase family protein [Bacteroides sp. ET336]MDN0058694.1 oligosaccharide flippase family protein [Bacteroides caecigallinarum]
MSNNTSDNNKRIAKNTIYLYIRQIFVMVVSLYTSRVVLATLGEVDYGIYNVVGGIVTLFTFLNFAMGCATNRFITFELGRKNYDKLNLVFSYSVIIHIVIAFIILIIGETIGLWFLNSHMNIPIERMDAARWVYQFSIFTCMVNIMSVPYNALIISYEKMNFYAILSIIETLLKLIIIWGLVVWGKDKLILYSILIFLVSLLVRILNQLYTTRKFKDVHYVKVKDKKTLKEMISYASWSLLGSAGVVFANQGQNIILNIFFGPIVNAARGISMQVKTAIESFASNFYNAVAPQINKSYASNDLDYMRNLILSSSRYMYYLLFIFAFPIILNINFILKIWLKDVPEHTPIFVSLMLCISMLTCLGRPLSSANGATGNIRKFQILEGTTNLLLIPITWAILLIYPISELAFIIQIIMCIILQCIRLFVVCPQISLSYKSYWRKFILPCIKITFISVPIPILLKISLPENFITFVFIVILSILIILFSVYYIGITENERVFINNKIKFLKKK